MSLTPEQNKKVSDAARAVELKALQDVIARQRSGKKLTGADLHLLKRLQSTPAPEVDTAPDGRDMRWLTTSDTAPLVCVTERAIRMWTRRTENPLPSKPGASGKTGAPPTLVQPWIVYEYGAAQGVKGIRPPPPLNSDSVQQSIDTDAAIEFSGDPHEVLLAAVQTLQRGAIMSPQTLQAIAAASRELRQKSESEAEQERRFKSEAVIGYLRAVGEAWVDCTHRNIGPISAKLLNHIKSQFDVDLEALNISAPAIVEAFLRTELRAVIDAVNAEVKTVEGKIGDQAA